MCIVTSQQYSAADGNHYIVQGNVVKFNQQGTRQTHALDVYQYYPREEGIQLLCQSAIATSLQMIVVSIIDNQFSCVLCVCTE